MGFFFLIMQRSLFFIFIFTFFTCSFALSTNGTSFSVKERSAYCFYYTSKDISVTNSNTWINGTSNNLYGYLSVYSSTTGSIDIRATNLAICTPNQGNENQCSTENISFQYSQTVRTETILVCMECHYWLGPCIFGTYYAELAQRFSEGYVDCLTCN